MKERNNMPTKVNYSNHQKVVNNIIICGFTPFGALFQTFK